jgi:NADH-quinone oxidoreductase subunit N
VNELLFAAILPEIVLCAFGVLIMVVEPFLDRHSKAVAGALAIFGLAGGALATLLASRLPAADAFTGMVALDPFGTYCRLLFAAIGILMVLGASSFLRREELPQGEFFALLLFATAGMNFMVTGADLVMTFVGLEILSIATYVLAGFRRRDPRSNESGMKYFFMGAFSSALLLYGIALIYGAAGSTSYRAVLRFMSGFPALTEVPLVLALGIGLVIVGFSFKVAAAPFHVWTPDVYEGAPTPVTAFMSVGPKAAGFAALIRLLFQLVPAGMPAWTQLLLVSSVLTMLVGNLGALPQRNIKRMLAYSSIAHAGYLIIGLVAANPTGLSAMLFYFAAYLLMNIGAFAVVALVSGPGETRVAIDDYRGLGFREPLLSFPLTICLVSLAGIPATAGFIGKFFLFSAAVEKELYTLVIIAILSSLVSVYYYLRVVVVMFMQEPGEPAAVPIPAAAGAVIVACSVLLVFFGLFPSSLLQASSSAVLQLLGR